MELERVHGRLKRRRFVDQRRTSLFTTKGPGGHRHEATFDSESGDGRTDTVAGHFHFIRGLEVQPAHGHDHDLTTTRGLR